MAITREFYSESGECYIIADETNFRTSEWGIYKGIDGKTVRIGTIIEAQNDSDGYDISLDHTRDGKARHIGQTTHVPVGMVWIVEKFEKEWGQ